jgi:glycosyltransferase involved in cell wall biosynthesis
MVVYSYFPDDERLRREAEALTYGGYQVSVLCLKYPKEIREEIVFGVRVHRLSMSSTRASKLKYILLYTTFFIRAFFKLISLYLENKYHVIHVHNMPDFLVFLGVIPRIFGAKIILDLHDPSPEIFMTKFSSEKENLLIRVLKFQEKISIRFANAVITTNKAFLGRFVKRGCPPEKINVVMNTPQESVFNVLQENNRSRFEQNKFIVMYHGSIVERHGLDILVKAVKLLEQKIPQLEVHIFGDGEFVPRFIAEVKNLELENIVKYHGKVTLDEIAVTIPEIDLGVIPNRIGPFTQINLPVRIFEYLCMKKPVVVPRTQGIMDYFDDSSIFFFNADDDTNLAQVILEVYENNTKTSDVIKKGFEVYKKYSWNNQGKELLKVYQKLLSLKF